MGATFGTLQQYLSQALGTSESKMMSTDDRKSAINRAIREILAQFDVEKYINETTMTFSSGLASLPTDCMRPYLLINSAQQIEWRQVDLEDFVYGNNSYIYKIKYNEVLEIEQMQTLPANSMSLTFFYVQNPADLVNDGDTVRFNSYWDQAIAEKAAEILLMNFRNFDAAAVKKGIADNLTAQAWQNDRKRLVGRQGQRLTSLYERTGIFGSLSFNNSPFTTTEMTDGLTWVTITDPTTSASGTANTGYIANNSVVRTQISLPVTGQAGDAFQINGQGASGWRITQIAGQRIIFGNQTTTLGATGYAESSLPNDVVGVRYLGSNIWEISFNVGTITLV